MQGTMNNFFSTFRERLLGKRGWVTFFRGGCSFYKKKIKPEILNDKKKIYKQKCFSVTINNLKWEILTKNLVTFKRWDGFKDERLWGLMNQYIRGNCLKRGLDSWTVCRYRGSWQKRGGCFWGRVDPQCTQLHALLHKTCIKVLRLNMCTSMISLNKIAHQLWHDHPFSERDKTTEWAVGVRVGRNRRGGQNLKKVGRQYREGLHKIGG